MIKVGYILLLFAFELARGFGERISSDSIRNEFQIHHNHYLKMKNHPNKFGGLEIHSSKPIEKNGLYRINIMDFALDIQWFACGVFRSFYISSHIFFSLHDSLMFLVVYTLGWRRQDTFCEAHYCIYDNVLKVIPAGSSSAGKKLQGCEPGISKSFFTLEVLRTCVLSCFWLKYNLWIFLDALNFVAYRFFILY